MIAVGMRHEDMRDGLAAHGGEQRRDVGLVERAGIDDRDLAAADDVGQRALERERAGIIGEHTPHAGRNLVHRVGREVEALVEGDVVGHAALSTSCPDLFRASRLLGSIEKGVDGTEPRACLRFAV